MRDPVATAQPLPRSFIRLLVAWFSSLSGDGLRMIALPLLAASVSPTPGAVAVVAGATALPWLLVAVPAGALVDRIDPVRAVLLAHLSRALVTLLLVAAIPLGWVSIPVLCAFGFLLTTAETFADGAAQTIVVRLIDPAGLERANSRFVIVETVALDLVGPLSAGVAFVVAPWLPFAISAAGFVVAAVLVAGLPRAATAPPAQHRAEPLRTQIAAGLRALFADRVLRVLVLSVAVMATFNAAQDAVLVLYATNVIGLSEQLFPTLLAAYSVGTLVAAGLVGRLAGRFPAGRLMLASIGGLGGTMLLMGLAPSQLVGWICYAVMGLAGGTWNVLSASRRQRRTPHAMVARVSSAFRVLAWGVMPIGAGVGGFIGSHWGVPAVFVVCGAAILALGVVVSRPFLSDPPPLEQGSVPDSTPPTG